MVIAVIVVVIACDNANPVGPDNIETSTPPPNAAPTVEIIAPTDQDNPAAGTPVTFTGTAVDPEDGDLTSNLEWTSSIDGPLGVGGSFTASLSRGEHVISASATDSGGLTGSAAVSVEIGKVQSTAPV